MLTADQVAAILGVSADEVYKIDPALLPRYKFGRAVRYDSADVEAYRRSLLPPAPPLIPARGLRAYLRAYRAAAAIGVAEPHHGLTDAQVAIADRRRRNQRMPPWANGAAIRAIYAEARRLTRETGIQHHVDHVIPLQGEFVTGLHVETNLQILPAADNIKKRNRYEGDTC